VIKELKSKIDYWQTINMRVFISYSFEDQSQFENIADNLELNNIPYWNSVSLKGGDMLSDQLRKAILGSDLCIFIATAHSVKSSWCGAELGAFWGAGKRVIIFTADTSLQQSELPRQFQGHYLESRIKKVVETIKSYMADETTAATNTGLNEAISLDELQALINSRRINKIPMENQAAAS
jgi:hypothetical protein